MARTDNLTNFLTDVSSAIKRKKGTTDPIPASEFDIEIDAISGGGGEVSEYFDTSAIQSGAIEETTPVGHFANLIKELPKLNITFGPLARNYFCNYKGTSLDTSGFDTSQTTNMMQMFKNCNNLISLDLSGLDTSKVTAMGGMFAGCNRLVSINLNNIDTSKVNGMGALFENCINLASLELNNFNTSEVTTMLKIFKNCKKLEEIPLLNASKVTSINDAFYYCNSLKNFGGLQNLGMNYSTTQVENYTYYTLSFAQSYSLTHESAMNIINNLYDIKTKGCKSQKVVFPTNVFNTLTADEIAIATNKGWNITKS